MNTTEKQLASQLDGIPMGLVDDVQKRLDPGHVMPFFNKYWKIRKQRVFAEHGISFGLEVCLDHLNVPGCRVLKGVLSDWSQNSQGQEPPEIALHLLTAGGMKVHPASVSAKVGGYILRNDGITGDGDRSELSQVQSYAWADESLSLVRGRSATAADLEGTTSLLSVEVADKHAIPDSALKLPIPDGCQQFTQQLVFYPPQKLPA